ncbi:DNA helicase [Vibrio phage phiKT1019]|nr:DNA helicase [Vibrio phage phiKT1019]
MKFVNSGLSAPQKVWVLTDQQLLSLDASGIGFDQLSKLPKLLERVPEQDVIDIALTQYRVGMKLGVKVENVFEQFNDDYKDILLSKIKTEQDRLSKVEHLTELKNYSKFYVHNTNDLLVMVITGAEVPINYISELCASFTELHVHSFTEAMLKALYQTYGYTYLHHKECCRELVGEEFNLAKVYQALV